jgi:hypothetical protein
MSGASVRLVCAEVRAQALERAALRLNCSRDDLMVVDGRFLQNGTATGQDYWTVAVEIDLSQAVTGTAPLKAAAAYRVVGQSMPRFDLPAKVRSKATPFASPEEAEESDAIQVVVHRVHHQEHQEAKAHLLGNLALSQ